MYKWHAAGAKSAGKTALQEATAVIAQRLLPKLAKEQR